MSGSSSENGDLTAELCALRQSLWRLEQELRAAMAVQWQAAPASGIRFDDTPGVALETRRLRVRDAVMSARTMLKHQARVADLNRYVLLKSMGGFFGEEQGRVEG